MTPVELFLTWTLSGAAICTWFFGPESVKHSPFYPWALLCSLVIGPITLLFILPTYLSNDKKYRSPRWGDWWLKLLDRIWS